MIGAGAINEIHINEKGMLEASLKISHSLSAIIICVVIQSYENGGVINLRHSVNEWIESTISKGQWIVTLGVTDQKRVSHALNYIAQSFWIPRIGTQARFVKGYIVTLNLGEKCKTLLIWKRIIGQLYEKGIE